VRWGLNCYNRNPDALPCGGAGGRPAEDLQNPVIQIILASDPPQALPILSTPGILPCPSTAHSFPRHFRFASFKILRLLSDLELEETSRVDREENTKMKSLGATGNPGEGQVPWVFNKESLGFCSKDSADPLTELKPKPLKPGSMRMIAQILAILVMILLPAGGYGSPLSDELYNQPLPSLNAKIVLVIDFYRAFHVYESLLDVRIEEGITFAIELSNPNTHELEQMKDFLGKNFSNLKKHGFSKLSIWIGKTRYVWDVK
jgi:hypothetical protein